MCYDADSCRAAAMAIGLEIGGAGHDLVQTKPFSMKRAMRWAKPAGSGRLSP